RAVPVAVVVTLVVAVVVVALLGGSRPARQLLPGGDRAGRGEAAPIVGAAAFDPPPGDGEEHDADLPKLYDGDPSTGWSTDRYGSSHFGNLKNGVGVVLRLDRAHRLGRLAVTSPSHGWSAVVYVSGAPKT